jgi:hypothetical protein
MVSGTIFEYLDDNGSVKVLEYGKAVEQADTKYVNLKVKETRHVPMIPALRLRRGE